MNRAKIAIAFILLCALFPLNPLQASPKHKTAKILPKTQIVVSARKINGGVEYRIGDARYTRAQLNEYIGERHSSASATSTVAIVLEDSMALSDIKEVPQMALDAGFNYVRVFVYWKGTGNMAELFFGPVVKHNLDHLPE
jgi:hypothetical protein